MASDSYVGMAGLGALSLPCGGEEDRLRLRNIVSTLGSSDRFDIEKNVVQPEKNQDSPGLMKRKSFSFETRTEVPILELLTQSYET
jgi:hypothetical protein